MKLLLDTHAVLWWLDDPLLLSLTARQAIAEPGNDVLVSAAVCWEIAIKRGLGKRPPRPICAGHCNGIPSCMAATRSRGFLPRIMVRCPLALQTLKVCSPFTRIS